MDVIISGEISEKEKEAYISYLENKYNRKIKELTIDLDGDFVNLSYRFHPVSFERVRRITGYLTGDMSTWNNAKRAEERDRVKHNFSFVEQM